MGDRTVLDLYRHDFDSPRNEHYAHWTPEGKRTLSTAEFHRRTCALAESLHELGLSAGDRVILLSDNRPEWHMADLAVLDIGAVDVPVYQTLTADQIAYQVNDSGAAAAIAETPEQMAKFLDVFDRCPDLRHLVQIEGQRESGVLSFDEMASDPDKDAETRFWERASTIDEQALASIIYTSGTTGDPKGVMLSHHNLVQNATFTNRRLSADPTDLALEFLPLCHTAERLASYCYMQYATSKAYCSVEHVGEVIATVAPTVFFAVPRVYEKVCQKIFDKVEASPPVKKKLFRWALGVGGAFNDQRIAGDDVRRRLAMMHAIADRLVLSKIRRGLGGRVRFCLTGAAETPRYVADFFHAVGIPMVEAYGLTETSPVMVIGSIDAGETKRGWVGRALDNLDVRLAADGELLVKGPSVMMGYWNKPKETAEVFDENGYLRTGDIGEIDPEGFVRIIDRKKDLIVTSGGKNVAPQPIESRLKESSFVDSAVVIGDGRHFISVLISPNFEELGRWAEASQSSYDTRGDLLADASVAGLYQEIIDGINSKLARYEQIREFRLLPVTLSIEGGHLTPTLKVKRRVVVEEFEELIDDIYAH